MPRRETRDTPTKKNCGGGTFDNMSPRALWESGAEERKIITFDFSYDEALKLYLSLQDCLLRLNKTNFATKEGKLVRASLAFKLKTNRVDVLQTKAAKKRRENI